ncbi:Sensor protein [Sterolibacterium denitrificans]|uniref:histidine kinase n=1 Tax=Sterolibacterium denitrificans TaxID=157592 RepID=A0A7Z7HQ19_9PROT|nr:Sensor protein [Sterolibacterium denitrificans]
MQVTQASTDAGQSLWRRLATDPPETFWRSLVYFGWYRFVVALVFLGSLHFFGTALELGYEGPARFRLVCSIYLLLAVVFQLILRFWRRGFSLQLTVQVMTDILLLTLLMHYSGGYKSGLTFMMLVVLAGAGLVGQGRLSLFFAAMATFAVLIEQARRALVFDADLADFMHSGIVGIGFFATAITARLLAKRVVANENLARQRGRELAEQLSVNERVIRDMQDGVLVVDAAGRVRQINPQAESLLGIGRGSLLKMTALAEFSPALNAGFIRWNQRARETVETLRLPVAGRERDLQVRFLPAGEGGNALIYLEDMGRIQAQAQQLKLAALGRLTANMAHEIRNPLAAISHAAELLADEQRLATRERLIRIIGDNTQRLNRLVAEVLELGRRDRAQPELLHLQSFVEAFVEEYALHDPRILASIVMDIDPEAMLWFDRMHLNRVLANLLGNALRHGSGQAGSLRLEARGVPVPDASSSSRIPGVAGAVIRRTELHVIDDGPGIDAAVQTQIFEPFYTTHSSGTGLGLYIARELCEANDARLELCANADGGASGAHFCLTGRGE